VQGLLSGSQLIPSLGSGAIPEEVLPLVREVLLHDPYHLGWLTAAAPLTDGTLRAAAGRRLQAEAVLRFGLDGTYDGATQAFAATAVPPPLAAGAPGVEAADVTTTSVRYGDDHAGDALATPGRLRSPGPTSNRARRATRLLPGPAFWIGP